MAKRLLLLFSLVLALLFLGVANTALGDVAAQLQQAGGLTENRQYEQAEQLYKQIVADNPSADYGLEAQEKLTCLYVAWDKEPQTQASLDKLLSDFSERDGIARAATHVADAYRGVEKHTRASEVYRDVIARWPNDEHAMWSQMGLAISHASLGDDAAAESAYEKLRTQHATNEHISRAVCLVADNYRRLERSDKARGLYEYALANWPTAEFALWSQMGRAISNIQLGEMNAADAAAEKLCVDFPSDARTPVAVCNVADEYRKSNEHERASLFYQHAVSTWPKAEHALWSQMGLAISSIHLSDFEASKSAVKKLLADFFEDERAAIAVCLTADEYRQAGKHEDAFPLYKYVVDNWPNAEHAMWSQMGLAISYKTLNDESATDTAIESLRTKYSQQSQYPIAVFEIGILYQKQGFVKERQGRRNQAKEYYGKAVVEWDKIINDLPESVATLWAYNLSADCYRRLGQYDKAVDYYETVIDRWPDYEYVWNAMLLLGRAYHGSAKMRVITQAEADSKTATVYRRLLEKYPTCKAAPLAQRWLSRNNGN